MIKKYQKIFCIGNIFLLFLCIIFLFIPIHKAFGLEATYPTVAGKTLSDATKLPDFALYLFNFGVAFGYLAVIISLVIAGTMYALSPAKPDLMAAAKDRVGGAISGLLILTLAYLIITTINPQLAIFSITPQKTVTNNTPTEKPVPGVFFYNGSGCPKSESPQPYTSSVLDLEALKNKTNSVAIIKNQDTGDAYVSILYKQPNLLGKCQYLDPNNPCQSVKPFASSASIYRFDFNPNGDGVYFYRKSYFNDEGGYYKVKNGQIGSIYMQSLDALHFINVPEDEQDCIKYDDNGKCTGRQAPSLAGKNISSIKINGNYLVLLSYAAPGQTCKSVTNDFCQEFPTIDDVNRLGPQQIKWEEIRNSDEVIPNCVTIIPIQR